MKTDLLKNEGVDRSPLEDPDTRAFAEDDPRSFLAQYEKAGAVFDEVQRVPEIFSYLQGVLDRHQRPGQFILTGSRNFLMMERVSRSLAGRVGIIKLLPPTCVRRCPQ